MRTHTHTHRTPHTLYSIIFVSIIFQLFVVVVVSLPPSCACIRIVVTRRCCCRCRCRRRPSPVAIVCAFSQFDFNSNYYFRRPCTTIFNTYARMLRHTYKRAHTHINMDTTICVRKRLLLRALNHSCVLKTKTKKEEDSHTIRHPHLVRTYTYCLSASAY